MNYLLTISYHSKASARATYDQLAKTMVTEPCKVLLLNNHYPLIEDDFVKELCLEYGFEYYDAGRNLGLHEGYNYLLKQLPTNCDRAIIFDGDSYPVTTDWHIPLLKVLDAPEIVWSSLYNDTSYREMRERGYTPKFYFGYHGVSPKSAVVNSVSCFNLVWIRQVGGFTEPNKYYGGLEAAMWARMPKDTLWLFLNDYKETANPVIQDPIYFEYKVAHAHQGSKISFDEYIKNKKI